MKQENNSHYLVILSPSEISKSTKQINSIEQPSFKQKATLFFMFGTG